MKLFFEILSKKNKMSFLTLLLISLFIFGCATGPEIKKTSLIDAQQEALYLLSRVEDSSQVKIVENFEKNKDDPNGLYNNLKGKHYFSKNSKVKFRYAERLNNSVKDPYLEIVYYIKPKMIYSWKSELNRLDVSQAKGLSFLIKSNQTEITHFSLKLTDMELKSEIFELKDFVPKMFNSMSWQEINIPYSMFSKLNLNALKTLELIFSNHTEKVVRGTVSIDSIGFVGAKQLYFESLKDNLIGFPTFMLNQKNKELLAIEDDDELLKEIARDTWKFFENTIDKKTALPLDYIKLDNAPIIGDYTSVTNIGLYLMSCVAANNIGFISQEEAFARIKNTLATLKKMKSWNGFQYNYYNTTTLQPTRKFISSVDSAWLAAGLIVARGVENDEISSLATELLDRLDFNLLYNSKLGQFSLGYDIEKQELSDYNYGVLSTEARVASLIAIGKGDIDENHWYKLYRTLPKSWTWQNKRPFGKKAKYFGCTIFQGSYKVKDKKIVPSWGGSLFEFLMPTLIIDEKGIAPKGLGGNNRIATELHIDYALNQKKYPVWGISPCSVVDGEYGSYAEFGIPTLGVKGYPDKGVITPHVSFLALDIKPVEVIENIRQFLRLYDIYGEYGFYDSVTLNGKKVSYKYLALDQGMIFISLVNYLDNNSIKKIFMDDPIFKKVKKFLKVEDFLVCK